MVRHCPKCNRSEKDIKFHGEFCERCAQKQLAEKVKKKVEITICKRCGRIKVGGLMLDFSEDNLEDAINKEIKTNRFKLVELHGDIARGLIMERTPDGTIRSDFEVEIKKKEITCDMCYKKSAGYYEATFQLRGDKQKRENFAARISRYMEKHGGFVTRIERIDSGIEVYVSNKQIAAALISADRLKPVRSYTLWGVRSGKKVYRNTYALRFGD